MMDINPKELEALVDVEADPNMNEGLRKYERKRRKMVICIWGAVGYHYNL